jgi:signal recognition particle subunit SEC65
MHVLLDNGAPRGIASARRGHTVTESRSLGWDELKNSELLDAAESAGFKVFVTTDKNIRYPQNLSKRKIAIVVLGRGRWHLIQPMMSRIVAAVNTATPGTFVEISIPDR